MVVARTPNERTNMGTESRVAATRDQTPNQIINGAIEKFEKQPEDGHNWGLYEEIKGKHCYCLVGALTSAATGKVEIHDEAELEEHLSGPAVMEHVYNALPEKVRRVRERSGGPVNSVIDRIFAVENYNDGVYKADTTKADCLAVLNRAEVTTRD